VCKIGKNAFTKDWFGGKFFPLCNIQITMQISVAVTVLKTSTDDQFKLELCDISCGFLHST
jgi:hypothetical protein